MDTMRNFLKRLRFDQIYEKYETSPVLFRARLARVAAKAVDFGVFTVFIFIPGKLGILLGLTYLALADSLFDGESLGKKLLGIRVVDLEEGTPCSVRQSFVRNIPLLIPFLFSFFGGWGWVITILSLLPLSLLELYLVMKLDSFHRVGDILAQTTVIGNDPHCEKHQEKLKYTRWKDEDQQVPIHREAPSF